MPADAADNMASGQDRREINLIVPLKSALSSSLPTLHPTNHPIAHTQHASKLPDRLKRIPRIPQNTTLLSPHDAQAGPAIGMRSRML